jgi:hypothetical protein
MTEIIAVWRKMLRRLLGSRKPLLKSVAEKNAKISTKPK